MGGLGVKAAVITGAGRGVGRAITKLFKDARLLTGHSLTPDGGYALDSAR